MRVVVVLVVGVLLQVGSVFSQESTNDTIPSSDTSTIVIKGNNVCEDPEGCYQGEVKAYFNFFANSNAVSNSFINAFLFSDFIEDEIKDDVSALASNENNRFGIDLEFGLTAKFKPLTTNDQKGFFAHAIKVIGLGQRDFITLDFSKNFFELYFRGNAQFAGQSIAAGPIKYTNFGYQYLGFGIETKHKENQFGIALNVLKGTRFTEAALPRATLFTSALGDSINFDADLNLVQGDGSQSRLSSFQGFGLSLDFQWQRQLSEELSLQFDIKDLGFINWSDMNTFSANSQWAFTGVAIGDILNIDGSEFNDIESDSLSSILGIQNQVQNKTYLLPARFQLQGSYQICHHITTEIGIRYYMNAANIPRVWATGTWHLKNFHPNLTMAYGGFSKADLGVGLDYSMANLTLSLQAFYIEPLISASKTTGQGFSFSLKYRY